MIIVGLLLLVMPWLFVYASEDDSTDQSPSDQSPDQSPSDQSHSQDSGLNKCLGNAAIGGVIGGIPSGPTGALGSGLAAGAMCARLIIDNLLYPSPPVKIV